MTPPATKASKRAIALRCGPLRADIRPNIGGALGGFWSDYPGQRLDWLRRTRPGEREVLAMACFPLVPFSNRIRHGRFTLGERTVRLPPNFGTHPHTIHGHGWQNAWQVAEADDRMVRLVYEHAAGDWPWPYRAEQVVALSETSLGLTLSLTNLSREPMPGGSMLDGSMPGGIGFHPYFPRTRYTTFTGSVAGIWRADSEVMPVRLEDAGSIWKANEPVKASSVILDNCFSGWGRTLDIRWRETARGLRITTTSPLDYLVVYTPPGEDFFCAEPVSHCNDAVNLATVRDDTGLVMLAPGETLSGSMTLTPLIGAR